MDQPNVLRTTKIGGGFVKEDVLAYVDELNSQIYALQEERDELKKKAVEVGKAIAPDSLDDKVEGMVDQAVDFLKDKLGKKEEGK